MAKIVFPGPVPAEAMAYISRKGLRPAFSFLEVWRIEHSFAFTVAKAMQVSMLESIKAALEKALGEGQTLAQFTKELTPILQRQGWWGVQTVTDPVTGETKPAQLGSPRRLKTIYQTNLRQARAAGQWDRIERTRAALPYLRYGLGPSEHHRPPHAGWADTLLPADDPWWDTHFTPNGWGCKCHVRQVSQHEVDTNGLRVNGSPKVQYQQWTNKRTGEVSRVPVGIDPGFDFNPGKTRRQHMDRYMQGKLAGADPQLAATAKRDLDAYAGENATNGL